MKIFISKSENISLFYYKKGVRTCTRKLEKTSVGMDCTVLGYCSLRHSTGNLLVRTDAGPDGAGRRCMPVPFGAVRGHVMHILEHYSGKLLDGFIALSACLKATLTERIMLTARFVGQPSVS